MSGRTARQFAGYQDAAQLGDPEFWATIAFTHQLFASRTNPTMRLTSKGLEASITPSTTFD